MAQRMSPNILKIQTSFFMLNRTKNGIKHDPFKHLCKKNNFQAFPISQNILSKIGFSSNQSFSAVFIINGGKIQKPCIQKVYLGFLFTDPTK
jgi:hypothetical protein